MPEPKEGGPSEAYKTDNLTPILTPKQKTLVSEVGGEEAKQEPLNSEVSEKEAKQEPLDNEVSGTEIKQEPSDSEVGGEEAKQEPLNSEVSEKEVKQEPLDNEVSGTETKQEPSDSEVNGSGAKQELTMSKFDLGILFIGLVFASFLSSVDGTIVSTVSPQIATDLKGIDKYSWIATSFLLTYNAFKPLYGKFSDIFGRRSIMTFSFIIFMVGSAGCGSARSIDAFIVSRAIQGVGGSGMLAMVFITISDLFSLEERLKYQAIIWASFGVSSVVGPILGGSFADHLTWRWAFYVNLPFGVIAIFCILFFLKLPFSYTSFKDKLLRIDWLGSILIVLAIFAILLSTSWGGSTYSWNSAPVISLYCASAVLIGLFGWVEFRWAVEPIVPKHILNMTVVATFVTNFFSGLALFSVIFYIPLFFQAVRGETATNSGLQLLPLMLGLVAFSIASGALANKTPGGYKVYITIGCIFMTVGAGLLSTLSESTSRIQEISYSSILGIGFGFELQMCLIAAQSAVTQEDTAIVTALAGFFQSIGGAIGISIANALLINYLSTSIHNIPPQFASPEIIYVLKNSISGISSLPEPVKSFAIHTYVEALQRVFRANVVFAGISFVSCLFIKHYGKVGVKGSTTDVV